MTSTRNNFSRSSRTRKTRHIAAMTVTVMAAARSTRSSRMDIGTQIPSIHKAAAMAPQMAKAVRNGRLLSRLCMVVPPTPGWFFPAQELICSYVAGYASESLRYLRSPWDCKSNHKITGRPWTATHNHHSHKSQGDTK